MADHPHAKKITTIGGVILFALAIFAATFGMGEWKSTPPTTAQAPLPATTATH